MADCHDEAPSALMVPPCNHEDHIDTDEFLETIKSTSARVVNNWKFLANTISRHELRIQKRWLKKSNKQRRELLQAAWKPCADTPMPTGHRPDFEATCNMLLCNPKFNTAACGPDEAIYMVESAFSLPYINLEDLSRPRSMLLLLNSRGRLPPDRFTRADLIAASLAFSMRIYGCHCASLNLPNSLILLVNVDSSDDFGKIIQVTESDYATKKCRQGLSLSQGFGILRIQDLLLQFLASFSMVILHEMSSASLLLDECYPEVEEPVLPTLIKDNATNAED